jgi:MFS family permease
MRLEFDAFSSRNYRLFLTGQSLSMVGHAMQQVGIGWAVYRLTGSTLWLGIVAFAGQVPYLLVTPLAGAFGDRWDQKRLLMGAQVVGLLSAALLTVLALTDAGGAYAIAFVALIAGIAVSIETPTRQALLVSLLEDRAHLPNAIAFYSLMFNAGRLLGPVIAGFLIAASGEWICFAANTLAYVALLGFVAMVRPQHARRASPSTGVLRSLGEGFRYLHQNEVLRSLIALTAAVAFVLMPYITLMPALVDQDYAAAPEVLGFLLGAAGFGAMFGNLFLATGGSIRKLPHKIALSACAAGIALVLFASISVLPVRLLLMAVLGWGYTVAMSSSNIALQAIVREDQRARLAGIYIMAMLGVPPLGSLAAGFLAKHIGTAPTFFAGGLLCALAGAWLLAGSKRYARAIDAMA